MRGRGQGDQISLIVDYGQTNGHFPLEDGLNPSSAAMLGKRYKICKIAGPATTPTTVEIYF